MYIICGMRAGTSDNLVGQLEVVLKYIRIRLVLDEYPRVLSLQTLAQIALHPPADIPGLVCFSYFCGTREQHPTAGAFVVKLRMSWIRPGG